MGGCCGTVRDNDDRKVSSEIDTDRAKDRQVKKLLLLGAGGSGKSTLFKQMQNILGSGFSSQEKQTFKPQIYEQIIEAMNTMICKCQEIINDDMSNYNLLISNNNSNSSDGNEDENEEKDYKEREKYRISAESMPSAKIILGTRKDVKISPEIARHLNILWNDPAIKEIFNLRNKICVPDSTGYFLDNLNRISKEDFIPNDNDLLLVRYRTTGMTEKYFPVKNSIFKVCDVGGQRSERRKWIHFFDNVTAVIYVASLSAYDEVVFEDEKLNSMLEGLQIFRDTCNSESFQLTAFILFLNKSDLFKEKIAKTSLNVCWHDYQGSNNYDESLNFIRQQFLACNKIPEQRKIYTHVTCATDTEAFRKVFNDVQHIIINWSLEKSGLI